MDVFQKVRLQPGEQAHVTTPDRKLVLLHCISGRAHVLTQHCGFRWHIRSGEHFLLRSGALYKIHADSPLEVSLNNFDTDISQSA
jgi:hypothetical protein